MSDETPVEGMRLVSVNEAAGIVGVRAALVYDEVRSGRLPAYRIGEHGWCVRIALADLSEWLAARRSTLDRPIKPTVGPVARSQPVRRRA